MNEAIVNYLLIKTAGLGEKLTKGLLIGGGAGALATVITQPLNQVVTQMEAHVPGAPKHISQIPKALGKETFSKDTWSSTLPVKVLKNMLYLGAAFGGEELLRHYYDILKPIKKIANVRKDLGIESSVKFKPSKDNTTTRWTPLGAEGRFAWGKLNPTQKKVVSRLLKDMPERTQHHNKDYVVAQLAKGKTFKQVVTRAQEKILKDPKVILK